MKTLFVAIICLGLAACAGNPEQEQEARCTYLKGQGRVGSLTQYGKGDIKVVRVVVGDKIKADITCQDEAGDLKIEIRNEPE